MNAAFLKSLQEPCSCQKEHRIAVQDIVIESGAIYRLNDILNKHGFTGNGYDVCDENTYPVAGSLVCQVINTSNKVILKADNLHANEKAVEEVTAKTQDADYYIAVGTGTIHDITRYVAHQKDLQFVSVPTGASVDGFVSTLAAMTLNRHENHAAGPCAIGYGGGSGYYRGSALPADMCRGGGYLRQVYRFGRLEDRPYRDGRVFLSEGI